MAPIAPIAPIAMIAGWLAAGALQAAVPACTAGNTVTAHVVALDQPFWLNRLGASQPLGMIFALERDVAAKPGAPPGQLQPGQVELRGAKRPRPLVLRANVGDCLDIVFTNLLAQEDQTTQTLAAGVRAMGMPLLGAIRSDGSWVGKNESSLIAPGARPVTYRYYAAAEGTFLIYSSADDWSDGLGGQLTSGLFGAINIEPRQAQWFRSQVTRHDLDLATRRGPGGGPLLTPDGQPLLDYDAVYPAGERWPDGTPIPPRTPILRMLDAHRELVAGDLTALIAGPTRHGYNFPEAAAEGDPSRRSLRSNPVEPDRRQPFREFTIIYHEVLNAQQAFPEFNQGVATQTQPADPSQLGPTLGNGGDAFAINYGAAGIGAEILANRFGVGPMGDCVDCKFEEFFLSSWTVGDPAMVVDVPANSPCTSAQLQSGTPCVQEGERVPKTGTPFRIEPVAKATRSLYPDDPSNVYHSYLNDHVKFRVLHGGSFIAHVHHLHAHQWLHTPNSDESTYLDSQMITPGTSYTMEIAFGGSGNLNKTAGDSIFHCHFYPHFAGGMWSLWRVHDVFEAGTELAGGKPAPGSRALPDGEIATGTPIPAVVPIPNLPMAPMPARVRIVAEDYPEGSSHLAGYRAEVDPADLAAHKNPGYPFFVPGVAGHRAPHPPLDFAPNLDFREGREGDKLSRRYLDGGLARHLILDGNLANEHHNQWDFSKDTDEIAARELPENGTPVERAAMAFHSTPKPWIPSYTQSGKRGFFEVNGLPPVSGAPYANPGRDLAGDAVGQVRRYKAADLQTDVVFSKKGWHYPQERHIALWEDIAPTVSGARPPEPLFFRANSETDVIEYWMTNLVPGYYELDDFQVRTPTDILGQHIHLVKFDVLASDGAANGFNYEDGSLSPDEVRERIHGIRKHNGCKPDDPRDGSFACPVAQPALSVFGPPPPGQDWTGAQTTIQRWYADPIFARTCKDEQGKRSGCDDRTLRTVFTHDHFGPSTHQQAGLYGGLLVEPKGSTWRIPAIVAYGADGKAKVGEENVLMGTRDDGGPTSWQADILTREAAKSYREFGLEFQDTALAYNAKSPAGAVPYPAGGAYPESPQGLILPNTRPWGWADCPDAVNPINNNSNGGANCSTPQNNYAAWPAIITGGPGSGSAVTNYRTEPVPLRVNTASRPAQCAVPESGDLSHVFRSICRQDEELDRQPRGLFVDPHTAGCDGADDRCYPGGFLGAGDFDPYTPLLRAYQGDRVQIRLLAGAHVSPHSFTTSGLRWLFEPSYRDSGFVATQSMGLSEHFEAEIYDLPHSAPRAPGGPVGEDFADYLYVTGAGQADLVQGLWGLLRAYRGGTVEPGLPLLPNNQRPAATPAPADCPPGARRVPLAVTAVTAAKALANGTEAGSVLYNSRGGTASGTPPIAQPDGLLYVRSADLDANGKLRPGTPIEPLVLHADAGDCIEMTLTNGLDPGQLDKNGFPIFKTPLPQPMGDRGDTVNLLPSAEVGLRPQLVDFDVTRNAAFNVGQNPVQTVKPGQSRSFRWYAGIGGKPAELGSGNLLPADPLMQDPLGLLGALVVEPAGASVVADANSRASVLVRQRDGRRFRDFVLFTQSDVQSIQQQPGQPAAYASGLSWGSGSSSAYAVSYRTEPLSYRLGSSTAYFSALSDKLVAADPETPLLVATTDQPARFRLAQVSGTGDDENLTIHGHVWQEEPWLRGSTELGSNPLSEWFGTAPHGPEDNGNLLLGPAGGPGRVTGDYLYRSFLAQGNFSGGEWGVFRVVRPGQDSVSPGAFAPCAGAPSSTCLTGTNTVNPETGRFAARANSLFAGEGSAGRRLGSAAVDPKTGRWSYRFAGSVPEVVTVVTEFGATSTSAHGLPGLVQAVPGAVQRVLAPGDFAKLRHALSFLRHPLGAPQAPPAGAGAAAEQPPPPPPAPSPQP